MQLAAKGIMIICDGMADRPNPNYGNQTPLEVAETPNMDKLAKQGATGFMDIISPGVPPGSDVAHLSLFGYDPYEHYTGRGGLEAAGAGIELSYSDIAFRCNFATINDEFTVKDRRAGRIRDDAEKLIPAIRKIKLNIKDLSYEFYHTIEHRGVLIFRGKKLSRHVSDTDPHKIGEKILQSNPLEENEAASKTAEALNDFTAKTYEVLKNHPINLKRVKEGKPPANILLSRGAGTIPKLKPITQQYGIKASAIAVVALVRGICRVVGMDLIDVPGATGGVDTDFNAKAKAAVKSIVDNPLTILHVKATDVASHDGNFEMKKTAIEKIDKMIGTILEGVKREEVYLALTADHTTPIVVKDHTGEPVPFLLWGPGVFSSRINRFCERTVRSGNMGRIKGSDLIHEMMNYMGVNPKFGF